MPEPLEIQAAISGADQIKLALADVERAERAFAGQTEQTMASAGAAADTLTNKTKDIGKASEDAAAKSERSGKRIEQHHADAAFKASDHKDKVGLLGEAYDGLEGKLVEMATAAGGFALLTKAADMYLQKLVAVKAAMDKIAEQARSTGANVGSLARQLGDVSDEGMNAARSLVGRVTRAGGLDEQTAAALAISADIAMSDQKDESGRGGLANAKNLPMLETVARIAGAEDMKEDEAGKLVELLKAAGYFDSPQRAIEGYQKMKEAMTKSLSSKFGSFASMVQKGSTAALVKGASLDEVLMLNVAARQTTASDEQAGTVVEQMTRAALGAAGQMGPLMTAEAKKRGKDFSKMSMSEKFALLQDVVAKANENPGTGSNAAQVAAANKKIAADTKAQVDGYEKQQREARESERSASEKIRELNKSEKEQLDALAERRDTAENQFKDERMKLDKEHPRSKRQRDDHQKRIEDLRAREEASRRQFEQEEKAIKKANDPELKSLEKQKEDASATYRSAEEKIRNLNEQSKKRIEENKKNVTKGQMAALEEAMPPELLTSVVPAFSPSVQAAINPARAAIAGATAAGAEKYLGGYTGSIGYREKVADAERKLNLGANAEVERTNAILQADAKAEMEKHRGEYGFTETEEAITEELMLQRMWQDVKLKKERARQAGDKRAFEQLSKTERFLSLGGSAWGEGPAMSASEAALSQWLPYTGYNDNYMRQAVEGYTKAQQINITNIGTVINNGQPVQAVGKPTANSTNRNRP